ncbi:MAG: hypothetical protein ACKOYN_05480 [Planctomycetota bacterium]
MHEDPSQSRSTHRLDARAEVVEIRMADEHRIDDTAPFRNPRDKQPCTDPAR